MRLLSRYRSRRPRTPKYTTWGPPSRLSTIRIRQLARQVGASARSSGASVMASPFRVVFPEHVVNTEVPGGHIQFGSMSPTSVIDATLVFDSDNKDDTFCPNKNEDGKRRKCIDNSSFVVNSIKLKDVFCLTVVNDLNTSLTRRIILM